MKFKSKELIVNTFCNKNKDAPTACAQAMASDGSKKLTKLQKIIDITAIPTINLS